MSFRSDISIDWTASPRIISIAAPSVTVSIQDLYDTMRTEESRIFNVTYNKIVSAGGKETLGGGSLVGVTLTLLNALLKFDDRGSSTLCTVTGGNLVAVDSVGSSVDTPLTYSTNVNVHLAQSSSATLTDQQLSQQTKYLIESQRASHSGFGNQYFWDPTNGNDLNDGLLPTTARTTFASIHDNLITDGNHDVIYIVSEGSTSQVITEQIKVTKKYTFIRGPGRDVIFKPSSITKVPIYIDAEGVEIDSVRLSTPASGSVDGIFITGNGSFAKITNCFIDSCTGCGIVIESGMYTSIANCSVDSNSSNGIILRNTHETSILNCDIFTNGGYGVFIAQSGIGTSVSNRIIDCTINHSASGDLYIGSNVEKTRVDASFIPTIVDGGTDSIIRKRPVWSEIIDNSATAGDIQKRINANVKGRVVRTDGVGSGSDVDFDYYNEDGTTISHTNRKLADESERTVQ